MTGRRRVPFHSSALPFAVFSAIVLVWKATGQSDEAVRKVLVPQEGSLLNLMRVTVGLAGLAATQSTGRRA